MRSIGRFRRVSKDLEGLCVEFMDELKPVWDNDPEAIKVLREMRGVLSEIDVILNLLNAGLNRLKEIHETCPSSPSSPQNGQGSGFHVMEEENPMSIKSIITDEPMDKMMDLMEEKKPMSINQEPHSERFCGLDGHDGGLFQDGEENPEVILI